MNTPTVLQQDAEIQSLKDEIKDLKQELICVRDEYGRYIESVQNKTSPDFEIDNKTCADFNQLIDEVF